MTGNDIILCASGGLDSTIAYFYLGKPKAVYFDMHTHYTEKELRVIEDLRRKFGIDFEIRDVGRIGDFAVRQSAYIPRRNLILALHAALMGDRVAIAGIRGDNSPDKSPIAFSIMTALGNLVIKPGADRPMEVFSPFWEMTKVDIVRWALDNIPDAEEIFKTSSSCYSTDPSVNQCGACASCFRKWVALKANGIDCDSWFDADIREWDGLEHYIQRVKNGEYDPRFTQQIFDVLEKEGISIHD